MTDPRERRAGRRLFARWLEASGERRFPQLEQVSRSVDRDLWDQSFTIDVREGPEAYRIGWVGDALAARFKADFTGLRFDALPRNISDDITDICFAAVASGKPVARGEDLAHMFGHTLSFRLVLLPVGAADVVEQLVGTLGFLDRPIELPSIVRRTTEDDPDQAAARHLKPA